MPPIRKSAGGIMFSGVRPSVRESRYREISRTPGWISIIYTWPKGAPWRDEQILGEIRPRSEVNELGLNML